MTRILIAVEGGLVQSVSTNAPLPEGTEVVICDYDIEGAGEEDVTMIPQGSSSPQGAVLSMVSIGKTSRKITEAINRHYKE